MKFRRWAGRGRLSRLWLRAMWVGLAVSLLIVASSGSGWTMGRTPERVVFIGRIFALSPGIVRHAGTLAAGIYRFDASPLPVRFYSEAQPDLGSVERALLRTSPAVVVISAFEEPTSDLGQKRALVSNLRLVIEAAQRSGATVLLLAHPPSKPNRAIGYGAAIRHIELAARRISDETGATLVPTGAFLGALPIEDRSVLYDHRSSSISPDGQWAVALTVAYALGVDVPALAYQSSDEAPRPVWIDLAEDWAIASGFKPEPRLVRH